MKQFYQQVLYTLKMYMLMVNLSLVFMIPISTFYVGNININLPLYSAPSRRSSLSGKTLAQGTSSFWMSSPNRKV